MLKHSRVPLIVIGSLTEVTTITAGSNHTCALIADGTVRCWGGNSLCEVGDGTRTDRLNPVALTGLANVTAITAGGNHTCVLLSDASVWCWGSAPLATDGKDPCSPGKVLLP